MAYCTHTYHSCGTILEELTVSGLDAETRAMVAHTLERFVAEHYEPARRLARLKGASVDYRENWPLLAGLGLFGLPVPAGLGGLDGGAADLAQALHVLAPGLVLEPVAEALVGAVLLATVLPANSPEIEEIVAGERIAVATNSPPAQWLQARRDGDAWRLRGALEAVPFAAQADEWLLAARSDEGVALLRMKRDGASVNVAPCRLMDGRPAADLRFDDTLLPAEALLQRDARAALARAEDLQLAANAADAIDIMERLLEIVRNYLRTRVQFGVTLGTFQALQHRLVDMHIAFVEARALLRSWCAALDAPAGDERLAELRRALPRVVAQAGRLVGQEAIQMHGGTGLTEELVVSHCNARLQATRTLLQPWVESGTHADVMEAA